MAALKAIGPALLSAILFAGTLPPFGHWWLAWFWLLPLLWRLWSDEEPARPLRTFVRGFRRGWLAGFFTFTATIWWIGHVTVAGMIALCVFLALYPAVWSGVAAMLRPQSPGRAITAALALALLWAGLEYVRGIFFFLGFPWNGAAVPLAEMPGIRILAAWTGVNGLSVLPVFFMSGIASAWMLRTHRNVRGRAVILCAALALPAVLTVVLWERSPQPVGKVQVMLVQPNFPRVEPGEAPDIETEEQQKLAQQQQDRESAAQRDTMRTLTLEGIASASEKPQLVVWPESALPTMIADPDNAPLFDAVFAAGAETLLTGADSLTAAGDGSNTWQPHNCAALLRADRSLMLHAKVQLVPFGEFLPFRRQIPLLEKWIGPLIPRDFAPGNVTDPLRAEGMDYDIIPLVCFEDTIARHARKFIHPQPQIMVNITNDNWFYQSNESAIHALNARWRCLELRRPMVRASLTGVTCVIDTEGRIQHELPRWQSGVLHASVTLPPGEITFYANYGDLFSITAGIAGLVLAIVLIIKRPRS
jgi:apolipoprotein N-acyltransferase